MKVDLDISQAIALVVMAIKNGKGDVAIAILEKDLLPQLKEALSELKMLREKG